jgi:MFS family permease
MDVTSLRSSPDFRRLFGGQTVSMIGSQFTVVAIAFQVYSLSRSTLQVGAVSLSQLLPFVIGALAGGVLGDTFDRRRVVMPSSLALALTSGGLALNALQGPDASVLAIYLVTAVAAGLSGVVSTCVIAAVPSLVPADQLTPAYALMQIIDQIGMIIGPALAGLLIAALGLPWLYGIDALTFVWTAAWLGTITTDVPPASHQQPGMGSLPETFRYLRGRQALQGAYLIDLCATVFGLPRALFPALTHNLYHGGPATLGLLYATPAAGALAGSLTSGWLARVRHQGRAVIAAVAAFGASIVAFGFAHVLWAALILLGLAGWADVISAVLRSTIVQSAVSEQFRSRISALQMAVVEGGPRLGDLESGAVATAVSPQISIVSGGIACLLGAALVAMLLPGFRRYRRQPNPPQASGVRAGPGTGRDLRNLELDPVIAGRCRRRRHRLHHL